MFNRLFVSKRIEYNFLKTWSHRNCTNHTNKHQINSLFITTPIFYVNSVPHIGHLYSALIADALHRFHLLLGINNTIFSVGTDEHGIKIERAARLQGLSPKQFCDSIATTFKHLFEASNITNTHFIRTTDESHINAVKSFWNTLREKNHIYKSSYEGWYSVSDETFVPESQTVVNESNIRVWSETGNAVEWSVEENYIFRLSNFIGPVLDWMNSADVIKPNNFAVILRQYIEKGFPDLSISRPYARQQWGIPVPGDDSQIIYVWLDALVNYLTVAGYPNSNFIWPPDYQIFGKDILRFHGVFWPAFLMAVGLELPRCLLCHSHWKVDNFKMSKSRGNVINPFEKMNTYSVDGLRYFLLTYAAPQSDRNYTEEIIINYLNAELADKLGNLLSRCIAKAINKTQTFPRYSLNEIDLSDAETNELIVTATALANECRKHYLNADFYLVNEAIMNCVRLTNTYWNIKKPWVLAKLGDQHENLNKIVFITLEVMRVCAILLQPIVPDISNHVLNHLNINQNERMWRNAEQVFSYTENDFRQKLDIPTSVVFAKLDKKIK